MSKEHLDQDRFDLATAQESLDTFTKWLKGASFKSQGTWLQCDDEARNESWAPVYKKISSHLQGYPKLLIARTGESSPAGFRISTPVALIPVTVPRDAMVSGKPLEVGYITYVNKDIVISPDVDVVMVVS